MDISKIDYWATSGTSRVHRATVTSKVLATALVIASVVVTARVEVLVCLFAFVFVTVLAARLPVLKVLAISVFPGLFAVLFALSQAGEGWVLPAVIVMKALTAASAMILLISTTTYTDVLGFIGRPLPRVVSDGLFMTYRSFFILIMLIDRFLTALKLRGGFQPRRLIKNAGNMSSGIGMLFIRAFDKSQMLYNVMNIRGYSGKLTGRKPVGGIGVYGLPYLAAAALFLAVIVYARASGKEGAVILLPVILLAYAGVTEALIHWKR
jgi:cobalt/nickel transport system permease protein